MCPSPASSRRYGRSWLSLDSGGRIPVREQFIVKRGRQEDRCGDPLRDYERLLEDLHDLSVVAERRDEPAVPLEEVIAAYERVPPYHLELVRSYPHYFKQIEVQE